jgi:hypothetical protein
VTTKKTVTTSLADALTARIRTHRPADRDMWIYVVVAVSIYLAAANIVFMIRHPWATETERLLCLGRVLTFRSAQRGQCGEHQ